jgi:hypothetical protein
MEEAARKKGRGEVAHRSSHLSLSALKSINQASCQCWDRARDGKAEFLAPRSKCLLVLLSVKWGWIRCWSEELKMSENRADSQMEVLHIIFPFNKLARERKRICRRLRCLVGRRGFSWRRGWQLRHLHLFFFFFSREDERQEQGERDEDEGGDDEVLDKCLVGRGRAVRLRPNRATPASINNAELDHPSINDGGPTLQSRKRL